RQDDWLVLLSGIRIGGLGAKRGSLEGHGGDTHGKRSSAEKVRVGHTHEVLVGGAETRHTEGWPWTAATMNPLRHKSPASCCKRCNDSHCRCCEDRSPDQRASLYRTVHYGLRPWKTSSAVNVGDPFRVGASLADAFAFLRHSGVARRHLFFPL